MREWQDYTDSLDYEELRKREEQRLAAIEAKCRADEAAISSRTRKITKIFISFAIIIGVPLLVYAATRFAANRAFIIDITPEVEGDFDFADGNGSDSLGRTLRLDDEISMSPTLTNTGSMPLYVFIRFDSADDSGSSIYNYSIESDRESLWTLVDTGEAGQICFAYVDGEDMKEVGAGEEISIPGTLRLNLSPSRFSALALDDPEQFSIKVMGCGIDTTGTSSNPVDVYNDWVAEGGEGNVLE